MTIEFTKRFKKEMQRLEPALQEKAQDRIRIFLLNSTESILHNHILHGEYEGCRSININGDYRAIYWESPKEHATFLTIGTHAQLYE